jgi:hypothetical protein
MFLCPQCDVTRSGKNWSPSQKAYRRVVVQTINVHHNCCKQCSPTYYIALGSTSTAADSARNRPPPPPPSHPSPTSAKGYPIPTTNHRFDGYAEVVEVADFNEALRRIRAALPVGFWKTFHDNVCWYGQLERSRLFIGRLKKLWPGYDSGAAGLKFMSYFGAVKAHSGIPGSEAWDNTGQRYFDPSNKVYSYILHKVWPGCLPGMTNPESFGDVMEAFLGFGWFMGHPDNMQSHSCRYQLQVYDDLHKVIAWVYDHWDERHQIIW